MLRFGIAENQITLLDGFESFIYEFSREDGDFILRVGHSLRRTPELIQGEVDWINYLAAGGANVAQAILSVQGNLVERLDDRHGDQFLATAFVKAPGGHPQREDWTPEFIQHYGRVMGRIHALSKDYEPSDPSWRRTEWDSPGNLEIAEWLPASETGVLSQFQILMRHFETLSKDRQSYGLIHQDAHAGNFYIHNGEITLFDFDDCVYGWFIYDIAMVLFYAAVGTQDASAFTAWFMPPFLRGYRQENTLDPVWLPEIPHFLKLREIDLYALIHRSFDVENLDDPWCANYMHGRKARIEAGVPFIEYDWGSLEEVL
jgi:Ser/Thr protein kinase RdoA (MazF antagonist)